MVQYSKQSKDINKPLLTLLRYFVYSKKHELKKAFEEGGIFADAIKIIFEGLIHDNQLIRKEAGKSIKFMLEVLAILNLEWFLKQ